MSIVAQLVFQILLAAGVSFAWSLTWMLAIMATLGAVFTVTGLYQKLTALVEYGAMEPFTGFSGAICEFTALGLDQGKNLGKAAFGGLRAALIIFGFGYPLAFILALIQHLA